MTDLEYAGLLSELRTLVLCAAAVEGDFREIVRRCELADSVGPIFQPSEWMAAADKLTRLKTIAEAAAAFQRAAKRAFEEDLAALRRGPPPARPAPVDSALGRETT